jgi:hypothetical protein
MNSTDHARRKMARIGPGTFVQAAAGALVVLALAGADALAASSIKDGNYHGALSGSQAKVMISFKVAGGGSEVRGLRVSRLPIYCGGQPAPGAPKIIFPPIKISASGTFAGSGKDLVPAGPLKGSVLATLRVSGRLAHGGKVSGTLTTIYSGPAKKCGGHSSYTTVA